MFEEDQNISLARETVKKKKIHQDKEFLEELMFVILRLKSSFCLHVT